MQKAECLSCSSKFCLCRPRSEAMDSPEADSTNRWQTVSVSHTSPTPPESLATVKSLIKSFDLGCPGTQIMHIFKKMSFSF